MKSKTPALVSAEPQKNSPKANSKSKDSSNSIKKPKELAKEIAKVFNPLADFDKVLDKIERSYSLTGSSMAPGEKRQTTGLLSLNLILAGGIVPAWYTTYGPEQSCKSTLTMWILCACLDSGIPIKAIFDYEGSTTPDYIENMLKTFGLDRSITEVFGIKNPKTDKWEVLPEIRYYSESIAEKFFDYLAQLERKLPDKKLQGGQWYYLYANTTENKAIVGNNYDVAYYKKNKIYRIPAPDGNLQALILLDSYPAMLPEKQDVDDPNSAIAVQARMFSEQLKRVKGKMKAKRIAVLGVNQLRKAPMAFGNPEQEPCGESLKFFSDVRLRAMPRSLSGVPIKGFGTKGMILEEPSVTGKGVDQYRFINIRTIKNKLSVPNLDTWIRLWIQDSSGEARGFDPVWDCLYYLHQTGQAEGDGKKITLKLKNGPEIKKTLNWMQFKILIIGSPKQKREVYEKLGIKGFNLKAFCNTQVEDGDGLDYYVKYKSTPVVKKKSNQEAEGEDDD